MNDYPAGTILGLLSDSHGHAGITRKAVSTLVDRCQADVLIHLGDVGSEAVLDALAGLDAHVVFGNCDWNWDELGRYAQSMGLAVDHPCGRMTVGGKSILYSHGHDENDRRRAVEQRIDYYFQGHTHVLSDRKLADTRLINPGALHRASRYTVAWLDPAADRCEIVTVEPDRQN